MEEEDIVVILDANKTMGDELGSMVLSSSSDGSVGETASNDGDGDGDDDDDGLGTTKFDLARCIAQELVLGVSEEGGERSAGNANARCRVRALITLGVAEAPPLPPTTSKETGSNEGTDPNIAAGKKRKRPLKSSRGRIEDRGILLAKVYGGFRCYSCNDNATGHTGNGSDEESSSSLSLSFFPNALSETLGGLAVGCSSLLSLPPGDFVAGIAIAADFLHTTGAVSVSAAAAAKGAIPPKRRSRVVLLTDARHEVPVSRRDEENDEDPLEQLARATNLLRAMDCPLQVVGLGFRNPSGDNGGGGNARSNGESEDDDESFSDEDESGFHDLSDVQEQNELLLIDLVDKLGGFIVAVPGGTNNGGSGGSSADRYGLGRALDRLAPDCEIEEGKETNIVTTATVTEQSTGASAVPVYREGGPGLAGRSSEGTDAGTEWNDTRTS